MKFEIIQSAWTDVPCDLLLLPLFEDESPDEPILAQLDGRLNGLVTRMKQSGEWKGKSGQAITIHQPAGLPAGRLMLVGAGKREAFDASAIRQLMMRAMYLIKDQGHRTVAVFKRSGLSVPAAAQSAVEGFILGSYEIDEYKTEDKSKGFAGEVILVSPGPVGEDEQARQAIKVGEVLAEATNLARSLVNEPGNRFTPSHLADRSREIAEKYGLQVEVLGEPEMQERGMNAVLAVARGSDEPPRFIILRHRGAPDPDSPPLVFVGKGVTFDSGGLSLKPADSMEDMKTDKAGACAVLCALQAIAQLQTPVNVIGLIPAVENLPSGRAQRPGDVIRSMSGKTIEVLNTDAEGRLILADALHFAKSFNPRFVIDFATLTGAVVVALGFLKAGLYCNDEQLYDALVRAAKQAGENFWRLPLDDEYRKDLDSRIADIKNVGPRWAGSITAAKFLQEFVGDLHWCHVDMAGMDSFPDSSEIKGPTGFGVRTMVQLALDAVGKSTK